jgi:hypothetical protein
VRVSRMKLSEPPGGNKPRHWMHITWCSLMNVARILP